MELKKRLSALFLALVMLLSVSVSAYANFILNFEYDSVTDTYSIVTNPSEYIGDVTINEYQDFMSEVLLYSLPTEQTSRYIYLSEAVTVGLGVSNTQNNTPNVGTPIVTADAGLYLANADADMTYSYNIKSATWENQYNRGIATTKGAYVDCYALVDYSFTNTEKLTVVGNIQGTLFTAYGRVTVPIRSFKCQLLINGAPVGDVFITSDQYGIHTINTEFVLEEDVENVGFRFFYDTQWSASASNIQGESSYEFPINFYFEDQTQWTATEKEVVDETPGLIQSLIEWVIGIYNSVFVPDSQKDDADNFQSEVSDTVAGADEVKDELDQLEKPDPEDIDTDLSDIITDADYTQQTQIFADLLRFDKITDMLMIVFTMALISYVLFGKKG